MKKFSPSAQMAAIYAGLPRIPSGIYTLPGRQMGQELPFSPNVLPTLDIYIMNADGSNARLLYGSSSNEADIDWRGDRLFSPKTAAYGSCNPTAPASARSPIHPERVSGARRTCPLETTIPESARMVREIVFERLVDDQSPHGNYDFFIVDIASASELRLTHSGYSQGLASWSNSGDQIVYIVAAIGATGQYDLYMMKADGTENRNITPQYFPPEFLCHWAIFSNDDTAIYFIGGMVAR